MPMDAGWRGILSLARPSRPAGTAGPPDWLWGDGQLHQLPKNGCTRLHYARYVVNHWAMRSNVASEIVCPSR